MTESTYVNTHIENGIATIEFYSVASNSLNSVQLQKLTNAILSCGENSKIHVIHLKSAGEKAFCAGASFDELLAIEDVDVGTHFFMGFANVINAIRDCSKIVITSVQGKTVGGGVGIAAASDYVFATERASIKLSELSIGIGPFVIEPAVSRKIGLASFTELTLNPTAWKTADWAFQTGLYFKICSSLKELDTMAIEFVKNLSLYNPKALKELKEVLWSETEHWPELLRERAAVSGKLVVSKETKEALSLFKNK